MAITTAESIRLSRSGLIGGGAIRFRTKFAAIPRASSREDWQ